MSIKRVSETNKEPTKAVLTAEKQKGVRTIYVDNLDGWRDGTSEDTAVPFVMYSKNLTTNEVISGSKTSWFGVVSKSSKTITNLILTGGEDQLYPAGTAVVATPTAQWANDLADALLTSHNPDGSLKAIETKILSDKSVTESKIADGAIKPNHFEKNKKMGETLIELEALGIKEELEEFSIGYGLNIKVRKVGRIVYWQLTDDADCGRGERLSERIPDKFIPASETIIRATAINNGDERGTGVYRFRTDGSIGRFGATGRNAWLGSGCYVAKN